MDKSVHLPKKVLKIVDLTFTLPDDFEGTFEDAVMEFLIYRSDHIKKKIPSEMEQYSSTEILLTQDDDFAVCGSYGLLKLNENGEYESFQDQYKK